jgi:hypothetical protein
MNQRTHRKRPLAFGCLFVLLVCGGLPVVLGETWHAWAILAAAAALICLVAFQYGDHPLVEKLLGVLDWFWWS